MASLYIPLGNPPPTIPSNVSISPNVPWHSSALLSAALETSILATRMKTDVAGRMSMGELAAFLDGGRKQNIAMLSLGAGDQDGQVDSNSEKVSSSLENLTSLSWAQPKRSQKKPHVFAEYLTTRGFTEREHPEPRLDDGDYHPLHTRFVGTMQNLDHHFSDSSFYHRTETSLAYPIVDSFPHILPTLGFNESTNQDSSAVETILSTDTSVIQHVTSIRDHVSRFIGVDEREVLINDLDGIIDAFQDGWSGDSDRDDDI